MQNNDNNIGKYDYILFLEKKKLKVKKKDTNGIMWREMKFLEKKFTNERRDFGIKYCPHYIRLGRIHEGKKLFSVIF